jgi:hypothetical protein
LVQIYFQLPDKNEENYEEKQTRKKRKKKNDDKKIHACHKSFHPSFNENIQMKKKIIVSMVVNL